MYSRDQQYLNQLKAGGIRPETVIQDTTTRIVADPCNLGNLFAYLARCDANIKLGDYRAAVWDARAAIELQKQFPQKSNRSYFPYLLLAKAKLELKKYDGALKAINRAKKYTTSSLEEADLLIAEAAALRGLKKTDLSVQSNYKAQQLSKRHHVYSLKNLTKYFILANQDKVESRGVADFSQEKIIEEGIRADQSSSNPQAITMASHIKTERLTPADVVRPFAVLKRSLNDAGVTHSTLSIARKAQGEPAETPDLLHAIDEEEVRQTRLYRS